MKRVPLKKLTPIIPNIAKNSAIIIVMFAIFGIA